MSGSFDGNDGNDGNAANAGGGGNATSASAGWFFADRVDLPFVTVLDTAPTLVPPPKPIAELLVKLGTFPGRNWAAEWYSWLALNEFSQTAGWQSIDILPAWAKPAPPDWISATAWPVVQGEIADLVTAAQDERANALGEILSQSDEFISYFLNLMTARPGAYPSTTKVLTIASLVGTFVAMYYKVTFRRPRPSQICPALLPPIEIPGHASFPSGHSTQAHLMALCMGEVLAGHPQGPSMSDDLWTLADRIARNREIAGLHYPSDSAAGVALANGIFPLLSPPTPPPPAPPPPPTWYQKARDDAKQEWAPE